MTRDVSISRSWTRCLKALLWAGLGALVTWSLRPHVPVKQWVFPTPWGSTLGLRVFARSEAEAVELLMNSTVFKP